MGPSACWSLKLHVRLLLEFLRIRIRTDNNTVRLGMFRSSSPLIALAGCISLMSPTQLKAPTLRPVLPL
jgi:hypothetical protein